MSEWAIAILIAIGAGVVTSASLVFLTLLLYWVTGDDIQQDW